MTDHTTISWLDKLNNGVIFVQFTDTSRYNYPPHSAEASYFGKEIFVTFPETTKPDEGDPERSINFVADIYHDFDTGSATEYLRDKNGNTGFKNFVAMLEAINGYIRSRPFSIVRQSTRKYQLLDPEGADYAGEYISLSDAAKTCGYNFRMED